MYCYRIPLVPRRPTSADVDQKAAAAAKAKDKKKKDDGYESPVPPTDPDEKLVFDAFHSAVSNIGIIVRIPAGLLNLSSSRFLTLLDYTVCMY